MATAKAGAGLKDRGEEGQKRRTRHTAKGGDTVLPRSGDVLRVTRAASVQFAEPMLFRVIRVHDWETTAGWAWLDGYQLDTSGDAVERRSIFVRLCGLQQGLGDDHMALDRAPAGVA